MMTMSPPQLALKNAFNSDRCAVGTWVMFSSAWNARIVASTGWDVSVFLWNGIEGIQAEQPPLTPCDISSGNSHSSLREQWIVVDCEHGESASVRLYTRYYRSVY
jgi:hypothetical protein